MDTNKTTRTTGKIFRKETLIAFCMVTLLTLGVMGAAGTFSNDSSKPSLFASLAESLGLKEKDTNLSPESLDPPQTAPQLSKKYIYAGSRMLAVEDYGIAPTPPPPTQTPTPGSGGGNPTPTPTPPPGQLTVTLTASPLNGMSRDEVVTWTANQSRPNTDYISLYKVNSTTVISTQNIVSGTSGTLNFSIGPTMGNYVVKYFVQGNSTPIAVSNTFFLCKPPLSELLDCTSNGGTWNPDECACSL